MDQSGSTGRVPWLPMGPSPWEHLLKSFLSLSPESWTSPGQTLKLNVCHMGAQSPDKPFKMFLSPSIEGARSGQWEKWMRVSLAPDTDAWGLVVGSMPPSQMFLSPYSGGGAVGERREGRTGNFWHCALNWCIHQARPMSPTLHAGLGLGVSTYVAAAEMSWTTTNIPALVFVVQTFTLSIIRTLSQWAFWPRPNRIIQCLDW